MFYNARWYDVSLGRFAQADSIVSGGIQGYDRYAYVGNSPLKYTDPSGHIRIQDGNQNDNLSQSVAGKYVPKPPRPKPPRPPRDDETVLPATVASVATNIPTPTSTQCLDPSRACATSVAIATANNSRDCPVGTACIGALPSTPTAHPTITPFAQNFFQDETNQIMFDEAKPGLLPSQRIPIGALNVGQLWDDALNTIPPLLAYPAVTNLSARAIDGAFNLMTTVGNRFQMQPSPTVPYFPGIFINPSNPFPFPFIETPNPT